MRRYTVTITERGQVTLPADIRRLLGVGPHDQVVFTVDGDKVHVQPPEFTLETAYRSIPAIGDAEDIEEMIRSAKEEHFLQKYGERDH